MSEAPPDWQCYEAPKGFGISPRARVIRLSGDMSALFSSVNSGAVCGFGIHLAFLALDMRGQLEIFFQSDVDVSNKSQYEFRNLPEIPGLPIFVTANYVRGSGESHYEAHRYIVSAYVYTWDALLEG
jgi:hypothetical protein